MKKLTEQNEENLPILSNGRKNRYRSIAKQAKEMFGEEYNRLKWFSDDEAVKANAKRQALLDSIKKHLRVDFGDDANGMKPHIGLLSPGCRICQHGGWDCSWINRVCNLSCFFCGTAHDPRKIKDRSPYCKMGDYLNPQDHVTYVRTMKMRGVGLSGGEPLLQPAHLIGHVSALKKAFGNDLYVWAYTNGVLLTPELARALSKAGLDELRFDVAACDYNLDKVAIAKSFIKTVTIEIPCIPDHSEVLKKKLKEMEEIGVNHLNLHQLNPSRYNFKKFQKQGYHFVRNIWHSPIYESEMAALELIHYAVEHGLQVPINYCSKIYKDTFQTRNNRAHKALLNLKPWQELTATGLVRELKVWDQAKALAELAIKLGNLPEEQTQRWKIEEKDKFIQIHPDLLHLAMESPGARFNVSYLDAIQGEKKDPGQSFTKDNIRIHFKQTYASPWLMPTTISLWQRTYRSSGFDNTAMHLRTPIEKLSESVQQRILEERKVIVEMELHERLESELPPVR